MVEIKNEQDLHQDFEDALRRAVLFLFSDDDFVEDRIKFGEEGEAQILAIRLNGELNTKWHFEYLIKNTDLYKSMQAIRAVLAYLAASDVAEMKMDSIYQDFLSASTNLSAIPSGIGVQEASKFVNIADEVFSIAPTPIRIVLKNLMGGMIPQVQEKTTNLPFYLEGLEGLHDLEILKKIIRINRNLFE